MATYHRSIEPEVVLSFAREATAVEVLYRAVGNGEVQDLSTGRLFRGEPEGRSLEAKLFTDSEQAAVQFGVAAFGPSELPGSVLQLELCAEVIADAYNFIADNGLQVFSYDRHRLDALNFVVLRVLRLGTIK